MKARAVALGVCILLLGAAPLAVANSGRIIRGAGTTIVAGGNGSPNFVPVTTIIGISWDGSQGTLDCLALAPSDRASFPGSGVFNTNIMYVTGEITAVTFQGNTATLTGTANCTGLGAGLGVPFTATAERGGPGARIVLKVSGLTFTETLVTGGIQF